MTDSPRFTHLQLLAWSVAGLVGMALLWMVLAPYVVPDFVLTAYQDRYADARIAVFWHGIFACVAVWAGSWLVWWSVRHRALDRLVPEASPQQLGGIRLLVCAILLINTLWEDLASTVYLPGEMRLPLGVIKVLQQLPVGFEQLLDSYAALTAVKYLTAGLLLLGCLGIGTRLVIPLAAISFLIVGGILREYSHGFHTCLLPLQLLIVLVFLPCGDGLSLGRRMRIAQGQSVSPGSEPNPIYGWSVFLCWTVIAMAYFAAALSKLRTGGWMWWHHENMQTYLFQSSLNPMHFDFRVSLALRDAPPLVFSALGLGGLVIELLYPLVLFSRKARLVIPAFTVGLHVGIFFLQNILFFDLIILQVVFWPWTALLTRTPSPVGLKNKFPPSVGGGHGSLVRGTTPISTAISGTAAVLSIVSVSMFVWSMDCEFYPLSSWGMFKYRNTSGVLIYHKPYVHYTNGEVEEAKFDRWIGAMADTRYRRMLEFQRHPDVAQKFLDANIQRANSFATDGRIIDHFEIQTWHWDFRNDLQSPTYGELSDIVIYPHRESARKSPDSEH